MTTDTKTMNSKKIKLRRVYTSMHVLKANACIEKESDTTVNRTSYTLHPTVAQV